MVGEASAAGVAGTGKAWGTGCAFVDYDRDGKLKMLGVADTKRLSAVPEVPITLGA